MDYEDRCTWIRYDGEQCVLETGHSGPHNVVTVFLSDLSEQTGSGAGTAVLTSVAAVVTILMSFALFSLLLSAPLMTIVSLIIFFYAYRWWKPRVSRWLNNNTL